MILYWLIVLIPVLWWWPNNAFAFSPFSAELAIYAIAKLLALMALPMIVLQLGLASRWPWLERWYAQDRLMRFHRLTGIIAMIAITLHPILLLATYLMISLDAAWRFILPQWDWKLVGTISLTVLIVTVVLAIWQKTFKLPYHWWKRIHYATYLVAFGGLLHARFLGSDFIVSPGLQWYWDILLGIALFVLCYRHVVKPLVVRSRPYRIAEIRTEAPGVLSFYVEPIGQKRLHSARPGQFAFVQFYSTGVTHEWHPFTISSAPSENRVMFTIKACGDWTQSLTSVKVGDRVLLDGPYGKFSYALLPTASQSNALVFIAGGIGITPIRSMIAELVTAKKTKPLTLFYSARREADAAFFGELKNYQAQQKIHFELFTEARFTVATLERYFSNNLGAKDFFVCGPPAMITSIKHQLLEAGVAKQHIHFELFSLK